MADPGFEGLRGLGFGEAFVRLARQYPIAQIASEAPDFRIFKPGTDFGAN
jgi:hypothetical protein